MADIVIVMHSECVSQHIKIPQGSFLKYLHGVVTYAIYYAAVI
jgi:hypothetical protein